MVDAEGDEADDGKHTDRDPRLRAGRHRPSRRACTRVGLARIAHVVVADVALAVVRGTEIRSWVVAFHALVVQSRVEPMQLVEVGGLFHTNRALGFAGRQRRW